MEIGVGVSGGTQAYCNPVCVCVCVRACVCACVCVWSPLVGGDHKFLSDPIFSPTDVRLKFLTALMLIVLTIRLVQIVICKLFELCVSCY